ncbi:MAG: flagella basal body P-ring formation protein FlgA [Betaproteobacteria bacterium]|nr:flagella basal body P-ring formation protein FlgA [Betaproteobacteria bacterium]
MTCPAKMRSGLPMPFCSATLRVAAITSLNGMAEASAPSVRSALRVSASRVSPDWTWTFMIQTQCMGYAKALAAWRAACLRGSMKKKPTAQLGRLVLCPLLLWSAQAALAQPPSLEEARARLDKEAAVWISGLTGQKEKDLKFAPLDARVPVQACTSAWSFDQPFGPGRGLRARCKEPKQQLFLSQSTEPVMPAGLSSPAEAAFRPSAAATKKKVLVAKTNLNAQQPIDPSQLELREEEIHGPASEYFTATEGLEYAQAIRTIKAGEPLRSRDIQPAILVRRGQQVLLAIESVPGLSVRVRLEAQEDGRFGQQIPFRNKESGRLTSGQVTGPGQARGL